MNKMTKTTGVAALIGGAVAAIAVIAGKVASNKDNAAKETGDVFEELENNFPENFEENEEMETYIEEATPAEEEE